MSREILAAATRPVDTIIIVHISMIDCALIFNLLTQFYSYSFTLYLVLTCSHANNYCQLTILFYCNHDLNGVC